MRLLYFISLCLVETLTLSLAQASVMVPEGAECVIDSIKPYVSQSYLSPSPVLTQEKYSITVSIQEEYSGEDKMARDAPSSLIKEGQPYPHVLYLRTPEEREPYRIKTVGGLLLDSRGRLIDSQDGSLMLVMDTAGNLYAGKKELAQFHHSSFLAGAPTAFSGTIEVTRGRIRSISNYSGHYKTHAGCMQQVLDELKGRGVDIDWRRARIY